MNAVILFSKYVIIINCFSIVFTFSFSSSVTHGTKKTMSALSVFFILTCCYIVLSEWAVPRIEMDLLSRRKEKTMSEHLLKLGESKEGEKDYSGAAKFYKMYLFIVPDNNDIKIKLGEVKNKIYTEKENAAIYEPIPVIYGNSGNTNENLILLARKNLKTDNFFYAYYYASLVLNNDAGNYKAKEIARYAKEKMASVSFKNEDKKKAELFQRKRLAVKLFEKKKYIEAYYSFNLLKKSRPDDKDIKEYLLRIDKKLKNIVFFHSEIEESYYCKALDNIIFLNSDKDNEVEIIFIDRLISGKKGIYFLGVERIIINTKKEIIAHYRVRYGKLINGKINTFCIDDTDAAVTYPPEIFRLRSPFAISNDIELLLSVNELKRIGKLQGKDTGLGIFDLWSIRGRLKKYGYSEEAVSLEILLRISKLFSFLVLLLFSLVISNSTNSRYSKRPAFAYLFSPLIIAAIKLLIDLFYYFQSLVFRSALLNFDFQISFIVMMILQTVLITSALLLLSGEE